MLCKILFSIIIKSLLFSFFFLLLLFSLQIEDPMFTNILAAFDKTSEEIGNGFIEDFFPPLRWWPTKKFKDIMTSSLGFNNYVLKLLLEHKASFDPSKWCCFLCFV